MNYLRLLFAIPALALSPLLQADTPKYPVHYHVTLIPEKDIAEVSIELEHEGLVSVIDFNIDPALHTDIRANGELEFVDGRAVWQPPDHNARLTLTARISQKRDNDSYDALMTDDWAIFRGDDLIPAARVRARRGAESRARLTFSLPEHWTSVTSGWEKTGDREFQIENPERRFSRPTGWMIAGRLGTRVDTIGSTQIVVSAPRGSSLRRMDVLTFLNIVWPELEAAFGQTPAKMAIIGHGDPMWRGGLSAPNSMFLHADRPMVSENGTSALVHELVHVATRIYGVRNHDWISEGIAEFYSFELLYRAGAMTGMRRQQVLEGLREWGSEVDSLAGRHSTGANTARAVVLLDALDQEIRALSEGTRSLDDVARELIRLREVSPEDLHRIATDIAGAPLTSLEEMPLSQD